MKNYFQFVPYRLADMLEVLKTYPVKGFRMIFLKTFHFDLEIILGWRQLNKDQKTQEEFFTSPSIT